MNSTVALVCLGNPLNICVCRSGSAPALSTQEVEGSSLVTQTTQYTLTQQYPILIQGRGKQI